MIFLRIVISLQAIGGADLFRKPVSTFRDHALTSASRRLAGPGRAIWSRDGRIAEQHDRFPSCDAVMAPGTGPERLVDGSGHRGALDRAAACPAPDGPPIPRRVFRRSRRAIGDAALQLD